MIHVKSISSMLRVRATPNFPQSLLRFVFLYGIILNIILLAISFALLRIGVLSHGSVGNSLTILSLYFFQGHQATDSWGPMLQALKVGVDGLPIYDTVFFTQHVKFQYPLPSLVPLYALQRLGIPETSILVLLNVLSWLAIVATIVISCRILFRSLGNSEPLENRRGHFVLVSGAVLAALTFFPLMKAYSLGQVQVFLTLAFSAALYCWLTGRERAAGVLIGLMILFKPQAGLFLCWFLLRKKFRPLIASLVVVSLGFACSIAIFGWHDHVRYLPVMSFMSRHGEAYSHNLSMNGFLNRLFLNGDGLEFSNHSFPAFNPWVYGLTLLTSAALALSCLFLPLRFSDRGGITDFSLAALTMTLASPIAWNHHYGILIAVYAWFAGKLRSLRHPALLAASFVLLGNSWSPLNVFANKPFLNMLQSLPLCGILCLLLFLYLEMSQSYEPATVQSPTRNGSSSFGEMSFGPSTSR